MMLKWLSGAASTHEHRAAEIVTDDPLATIRAAHKVDKPLEIYAVSRVNPIFDEEEEHGQAGSSGYGSNRCTSSSEYSGGSGAEQEEERCATVLRDDAVTVLEQNAGFVKSILVAVSPRARLSPIPEGRVDSVPRPVWPKPADSGLAALQQDSLVDDALLLYTTPVKSEEALRNLSVSLSHREPLNKMTRALGSSSASSSSSSGFSERDDVISVRGASEKLLKRVATPAPDVWETYRGAGVTAGDVRLKPAESYYYPSFARPDFTLDRHRAERLMRKIKSAKRRRFWCRLVTSLLGLVFFLMSVMMVSLLVTRGKRVFGPL